VTSRLATATIAVTALLALAGCGDDEQATGGGSGSGAKTEPAPAQAKTAQGCDRVAPPEPKPTPSLEAPTKRLSRSRDYTATVSTSCGDFVIELDVRRAPKTTASFVSLAQDGFYDDLIFHRIVAGFVIQGGDPVGDGTGGPGYSVTEDPPARVKYPKGAVAMAKTEAEAPGTSGSQFYVVTAEEAPLEPVYAFLGKVTKGLDVVDRIGVAQTDPTTERPVDPIVIEKVTIESS